MYLIFQNGRGQGERNFSKKSCGESENVDHKKGLGYGVGQVVEGVTGSFGGK